MEMSSKGLGSRKASSSRTFCSDDHNDTDRQMTNSHNEVFIMTGFSPPSRTTNTTSLSGKSPGTGDDLHDVLVHLDPHLRDDVQSCRLGDPKLHELSDTIGGNEVTVPVNGGKTLGNCLLVGPVFKKVAETDKARGGRRAAVQTTPYLCSDHGSVLSRDLNASLTWTPAEGGRGREGPAPDMQRYRNWFSIIWLLPGPAPVSRHGWRIISNRDQKRRAGSQSTRTGHNRQILAEIGVAGPPVQADCFLQALQLVKLEADKAEDTKKTTNVVSVVLTTFLPLSGQQNIGR